MSRTLVLLMFLLNLAIVSGMAAWYARTEQWSYFAIEVIIAIVWVVIVVSYVRNRRHSW